MSTLSTKLITAAQLLKMGDIGRCELIYGELIMMSPAGMEHGMVASRIARLLDEFVEKRDLGIVLAAETGFKIATNPDLVRAPDASFIRKDRLPKRLPRGFFTGVPDLAVEVISPDDSKREVLEKACMWLSHGTLSVWVADPNSQNLTIHRTGKKPMILGIRDEITGEPALPGFVLPIARIFKRP